MVQSRKGEKWYDMGENSKIKQINIFRGYFFDGR